MEIIENKLLRAVINPKGAELSGLFNKKEELEYLWNGDPAFWGKQSPVLFPIVGTLKGNSYLYKGGSYQLPRHGFARDRSFEVEKRAGDSKLFLLKSDMETQKVYPFDFEFRIHYSLEENKLIVSYEIKNSGEEDLYFSVGGHPAFKLPLVDNTAYEDYYLEFEKKETAGRWPISGDGLIEKEPVPALNETNILPINKLLFAKDALVFKNLNSSFVKLKSDKTRHGLTFHFPGFPFLGIWAAEGADFICIEPWCGIADTIDSDQQLVNKEGIISLKKGEEFKRVWSAEVY